MSFFHSSLFFKTHPRPAAHSIFKNPREMDEDACPPLAERIGGGAGAGTESNRTTPVQSQHADPVGHSAE